MDVLLMIPKITMTEHGNENVSINNKSTSDDDNNWNP